MAYDKSGIESLQSDTFHGGLAPVAPEVQPGSLQAQAYGDKPTGVDPASIRDTLAQIPFSIESTPDQPRVAQHAGETALQGTVDVDSGIANPRRIGRRILADPVNPTTRSETPVSGRRILGVPTNDAPLAGKRITK